VQLTASLFIEDGATKVAGTFFGPDRAEFKFGLLCGIDEVLKRPLGKGLSKPYGGSDP
jgi:hypothetical protein